VERASGSASPPPGTTVDAFLGGKVEAVQPAAGHHRSGLEAVLLAASLPEDQAGIVVDLGAGAGVAGLAAAARCAAIEALLVERDRDLLECARLALARPANRAFAGRVKTLPADILDSASLAVAADRAAAVLVNPPFNDAASMSPSPKAGRAGAHVLGEVTLDRWLAAAAGLLAARGRVTVIFRAEGIAALLAALTPRFGGLDILPVHPRAGAVAHRVMITGVKGSRAAPRLLPPLVLHGAAGNAFRPEIEAILRGQQGLAEIAGTWQTRR
jgi:tRNA1(Val) A37 N6-methylase TrmN6